MGSIFQILLIFSTVLSAEALKPNIYFTYLNKTDYDYSSKILYLLHVHKNASIPFELTNYYTIWMETSLSQSDLKVYGGILIFINKTSNTVSIYRNLFERKCENKTSSNQMCYKDESNFKFSLNFVATDIIESVTKCIFRSYGIYSKVSIVDYLMENKNLTVRGRTYPTRLDAYLNISDKAENLHCKKDQSNLILIFVASAISVVLGLIFVYEVLKFVFGKPSRVDVSRS